MSDSASFADRVMRRRSFFRVAGATAVTSALVLAGCDTNTPTPVATDPVLSLGSGDTGIMNYAYLLEQLEAAFYQKIIDTPPSDLRTGELAYLIDLRDHEVIHREFFKYVLGTTDAIQTQEFDFSTLTLTTRAGVLAAAKTIEDLGVAAYNGVGKLVANTVVLTMLSKISSVEARHAALIRDLQQPGAFADTTVSPVSGDGAGLDLLLTPTQVLEAAKPFFKITYSVASLPTS
ncbi:ferritin-like domain-containing protein [Hymenobacter jejuensis]|uniref:Ferritin-like domain-containing protein n=1 Tax=Hymenobacter jejuensis TaxID=2502781 RepID=A0A5B8A042_9BACT|nr:ferritin-like domain-containing protein [Hymenobacter jejuensis]QDA60844.1 ferritin-like domain-containing protein [Hymenobacter jejuensis]